MKAVTSWIEVCRRAPLALMLAIAWIAAIILVAATADLLAPFASNAQDHTARLAGPLHIDGSGHFLGTDQIGRDLYSRLLFAIQISVSITLLSTCISAVIGVVLGAAAAHFRGPIGGAIMALVDMQAAVPYFIFAICILAVIEPTYFSYVIILGLAGWERYARLVRLLTLNALADGYARSALGMGATAWRIYTKHIAPNITGPIIVQATLSLPSTLLLESGLSFLGLGVQPPAASLGSLVAEGQPYVFQAWWLILFPSLAIFATGLSISVIGERLRGEYDLE